MSYPKFVFFGDSITEYAYEKPSGMLSSLSDSYVRRVEVVARGLAGYNTRWAKPHFEPFLNQVGSDIEAIVIFFGTNDAANPTSPQHVPLTEYSANLKDLIDIAKKYSSVVIVVGTTVIDEYGTHEAVKTRTNKLSLEYNKEASRVAAAERVEFLDLWTLFREANNDVVTLDEPVAGEKAYSGPKSINHLVHDGLHFSGEGYDLWYKALKDKFESLQKGVQDYPYVVPPWGRLVSN